ncbi:MAG: hypothetical protein A2W25_06835 [candidate division Zixibacteria bacterium RBG_16_53_22]|nr:MAG: hypothetical protein A2W25_06835 [candidate division Zixibacteria bacterium RBG_16_53_22]
MSRLGFISLISGETIETKMRSTFSPQILALALAVLWGPPAQTRDFKIHVDDLPRLIFDPGHIERDSMFILGPADQSQFYDYLNRNSARGRSGFSLIRPHIIGPGYRGYTEKYWYISPEDSIAISLMRDYEGFERIGNIFVVWEQRGDSLSLKCVLDSTITTAMGILHLAEVSRIRDKAYLIICLTHGGDEGAFWGSLFLYNWNGSCFLKTIHEMDYSTQPCLWREEIAYDFDRDSLIVHIIKKHDRVIECEDEDNPAYVDSAIVTTERVDLLRLLR